MTQRSPGSRPLRLLLAAYVACVVAAWVVARVYDESGSLAGVYLVVLALPAGVLAYAVPDQLAPLLFEVTALLGIAQGFAVGAVIRGVFVRRDRRREATTPFTASTGRRVRRGRRGYGPPVRIQVGRLKVVVGSLLMGGSAGALGGTPGTVIAGLVFGLGLGTVLSAFTPDTE